VKLPLREPSIVAPGSCQIAKRQPITGSVWTLGSNSTRSRGPGGRTGLLRENADPLRLRGITAAPQKSQFSPEDDGLRSPPSGELVISAEMRRPGPAVVGASERPLGQNRHAHKAGWISQSGSARHERTRSDLHS